MRVPTYDVIVIGLGGMGSAAACRLAGRGLRVLGLDRHRPGHDQGSSHGGSRITRQAYFEDPAYVPLLLRAAELWPEVEAASGRTIAVWTGGVMVGRPDSRTVAGSLRSAQEWDLPHELLDAAEIRRRFPTMTPDPGEVALYERGAGLVIPEESVAAHLDLAARAGAELHHEEPVTRWRAGPGGGVRVTTGRAAYTAGQLVICPGAWAPELLAGLAVPFGIERQVQYWFAPAAGIAPFRAERHPVYIWEAGGGRQFYGFPSFADPAEGVKVAFFRGGAACTPDTIDRTVAAGEVEAMRAFVAPRLPDRWSGRSSRTSWRTARPGIPSACSIRPGWPPPPPPRAAISPVSRRGRDGPFVTSPARPGATRGSRARRRCWSA